MMKKHMDKLPWVVTIPLTALWAWAALKNHNPSFWNFFIGFYVFGLIWWFLFALTDLVITKYKDKELLDIPEVRTQHIKQKLGEIEELKKGGEDEGS